MRSKWHTLAIAGSLGLFAAGTVVADDNSSSNWLPQTASSRGANSPSGGPADSNWETRRTVSELLRQAMIEMDAQHFEAARRLARRAAAVGVAGGFAGVHPEQILEEINRRERAALVAVPVAPQSAAAGQSSRSYKAGAIELLDHGIQALEEKRFDDAERFARQAGQLDVAWDKLDYRPENLLEEIRRQRVTAASEPAVTPRPDATFNPLPGISRPQPTAWANRTSVPSTSPAETTQPAAISPAFNRPAQSAATAVPQSVSTLAPAANRTPAQALLQQAMEDLQSGRDEVARTRIEQALNAVTASQSPPLASFSSVTPEANRPTGTLPSGIAANSPATTLAPAPAYFPIRRDQVNAALPVPAGDVALKPMHDPYLGDEPTTTDKSGAGAQSLRESLPVYSPVNSAYLSGNSTPSMPATTVQRVAYETPTRTAAPRIETDSNAPSLNPQINWLQKMSQPIPQGTTQGFPAQGQPPLPQHPFNPVPQSPPPGADGQWSGRMSTPSGVDPAIANSPDQPKPGFFHRMWDAISGE